MATDFIQTLKSTGGDFSLMSTWEAATQCDLTAATTKVFSHGGITGAIANNASVTGASSGATGTVVAGPTSTQILIDGISGTFTSGEAVEVDGSNYVTISDAGDSANVVLECYKGTTTEGSWQADGSLDESGGAGISGWTTNATNFITVKAAAGNEHNGVIGAGFSFTNSSGYRPAQQYTATEGIEVGVILSAGSNQLYDKLIISAGSDLGIGATNTNSTIRNCLFFTVGRAMDIRTPTGVLVENCTFIANGTVDYGLLTDSSNTVKNCVSYGYTNCFLGISATDLNCASGDTTASSSTNGVTGITSTAFVDYVNDDYQPTSSGALAGTGTDLSADFLDDITGTPR